MFQTVYAMELNKEIISISKNTTKEQVKVLKPTMTYADVKRVLGDT